MNQLHNQSASPSSRLLELDALRGLAILSILAFHYTTRYDIVYGHISSPLFHPAKAYGVNLFFMISGFVTFMTIQQKESITDFLISRFSRLYPCYLLGVFLTFGVLSVFHLPGHSVTPYQALINLTMFPYLFGVNRIDGVYWALYVIVSFYCGVLLVMVTGWLNKIRLLCFIWLCIQIIEKLASSYLGMRIPARSFMLLEHGHLFIAGILFYRMWKKPTWIDSLLVASCVLIQALQGDWVETVFLVGFCILFYLIIIGRLSLIAVKPLLFLGTISYALFLIHQNVGYVVIHNLSKHNLNPNLSVAVAFLVSLLLATLMTYLFETPLSSAIRTGYKVYKRGLLPDKRVEVFDPPKQICNTSGTKGDNR